MRIVVEDRGVEIILDTELHISRDAAIQGMSALLDAIAGTNALADVVIVAAPKEKKIEAIKLLRCLTGWTLKDAKNFFEGLSPNMLNKGVLMEQVSVPYARDVVHQLIEAGFAAYYK